MVNSNLFQSPPPDAGDLTHGHVQIMLIVEKLDDDRIAHGSLLWKNNADLWFDHGINIYILDFLLFSSECFRFVFRWVRSSCDHGQIPGG